MPSSKGRNLHAAFSGRGTSVHRFERYLSLPSPSTGVDSARAPDNSFRLQASLFGFVPNLRNPLHGYQRYLTWSPAF